MGVDKELSQKQEFTGRSTGNYQEKVKLILGYVA